MAFSLLKYVEFLDLTLTYAIRLFFLEGIAVGEVTR